jgi:hypothetical protein
MGIYIPVSWLQAIHYYYYFIGIFSFGTVVIFSAYPTYALVFVISYILNSGICWYMSWWLHKKVKKELIINYTDYAIKHVFVTLASITVLGVLLLIGMPESSGGAGLHGLVIPRTMDYIVWFNYFSFFAALIWSVALRFDILNKAFATFNSYSLRMAKSFAIKKRKELGLDKLVPLKVFETYELGTDDNIDSILTDIGSDKKNPKLRLYIRKLELAMCQKFIDEMAKRVQKLEGSKALSGNNSVILAKHQKLIYNFNKESYKYEQELKREESDFYMNQEKNC